MTSFMKSRLHGSSKAMICMSGALGVLLLFVGLSACSPQKKASSNPSPNNVSAEACDRFLDSASCTNSGNCDWTGSLCSGNSTYCAKFTSEGNCPVSCRWNMTTYQCQPLPQQSQNVSCGNYMTQQNCLQVSGCTWNGYNCITSGGTAGPTTGNSCSSYSTQQSCSQVYGCLWNGYSCVVSNGSTGSTTGSPYPTTGTPGTTTGAPAPVSVCTTLDTWQCVITQGCRLAIFPNFGCIQIQQ